MSEPDRIQAVVPTRVERTGNVFLLATTFILRVLIASLAKCVAFVCYGIRILGRVLAFLKLPVAAFLAGLFMASLVSFGLSALWRTAQTTLMAFDVCKLPMVCSASNLISLNVCNLPFIPIVLPSCDALPATSVGSADFPALLAIQNRAFEELVAGSTTNSELVVNVKHAELAIRDLVVLVKASNLTSKEPLADALSQFSVDARRTGRGLQLLMSKIHGTIDRIIAYNSYALNVIEGTLNSSQGRADVDAAVLRTFQSSMASFSASVAAILVEATSVWTDLDLLEERLLTIHTLSVQEALDTDFAKDELFWQLWTLLGGNRRQLRELANRASVLLSVQQYRALASAYIAATVQALTVVDADLTVLREQLSVQAIVGEDIPVEVHIKSLESSLHRVKERSGGSTVAVGQIADSRHAL